jgi:FixJ family two-component response regulator
MVQLWSSALCGTLAPTWEHVMANAVGQTVVYIVDDDSSVRGGLSRLMRSVGLSPEAYASAEEFLAHADPACGGCILLDITMPHVSGLQLQAELLKRKIGLPVIAVSARDDAETRNAARRLNACFFLRKPVDDQALIDAIQWVLTPKDSGSTTGQ